MPPLRPSRSGSDDEANDASLGGHRFFAERRDSFAECRTPPPSPPGQLAACAPPRPSRSRPRRFPARKTPHRRRAPPAGRHGAGSPGGAAREARARATHPRDVARVSLADAARLVAAGVALFLLAVVRLHVMMVKVDGERNQLVLSMEMDENFLADVNALANPVDAVTDFPKLRGAKRSGAKKDVLSLAYHQDPSDRHEYVIDVISIGSETRPDLLRAQVDTWAGSHRSVRHFWGLATGRSCPDISAEDVATLVRTCRSGSGFDPLIADHARRYYGFGEGLEDHADEADWLCAQRSVGSLLGWLQAQYADGAGEGDLPDLLVVAGDDTFLDVDQVRRFMRHQAAYAGDRPLARAACVVQEDRGSEIAFSFPYMRFGTFLDKNALRDMIRPIKCTASDGTSAFDKRICSMLKEDRIGELSLFEEGMTMLDLFHKYSSVPVYCMHSVWILGYIVKYYLYDERSQEPESTLLGMETYPGCGNMRSETTERPCEDTFTSCHNMKPEDMESLALSSYLRAPDSFSALPHLTDTTMTAVTSMISEKKVAQEVRSRMLLPNVQLIGAQKAGMTSITQWLLANGVCNPAISAGEEEHRGQEAHFFDEDARYEQGPAVYSHKFEHCKTEGDSKFVMDATPNTLLYPKRVYDTYNQVGGIEALSKVKLIAILRDPISREMSLYNHKRMEYLESCKISGCNRNAWYSDVAFPGTNAAMSFEQYSQHVLAGQLSNQFWKCDGKYIDHLKQWMSYFDRKQLLVLSHAEIQEAPEVAERRVQEFLEAKFEGHLQVENESKEQSRAVPPMARKVLDPLFKKKNSELYKFLDEYPGPPMEQHPFPRFTSESLDEQIKNQSPQRKHPQTKSEETAQTANEIKPAVVGVYAAKKEVQETRMPPLLPNVLLIGAQKAGTESISDWLFSSGVCHPKAFGGEPGFFEKEVQFFDQTERYLQGLEFYSRRFEHCRAKGDINFVMDASPRTLLYPMRVVNTYNQVGTKALSEVKLIVILRDPVSRELSLYNHKRSEYLTNQKSNAWYSDVAYANNNTLMSFEEYSKQVLLHRLTGTYWKSDGKYIDHLKKWVSYVRREQMLILSYVEVQEAPQATQKRIREFLGVDLTGRLEVDSTQESKEATREVPPMARKVLEPIFEAKNLELYKFLDQHNGPPMEQYPFPNFTSDLATQTQTGFLNAEEADNRTRQTKSTGKGGG